MRDGAEKNARKSQKCSGIFSKSALSQTIRGSGLSASEGEAVRGKIFLKDIFKKKKKKLQDLIACGNCVR